jgi:diguanylate cyclase (GGDEF)-like protein
MIFERSRILVVEDDPTSLRMLAEILRHEHELIIATNCNDALKLLAEKPDLILLDLYLGDSKGIEVLSRVKSDPELQDIPVLCVTSSTETNDIEEAFHFGAVDYITKPYNEIILQSKVNTFLDLSRKTALLHEQANTDALTGLSNRRQLDAQLPQLWLRMADEAKPMAAIMIDLDDFKGVNDYFGHPVGDATIKFVGSTLAQCVDPFSDLVFRIGGDEFVVLLPGVDFSGALKLGETIREKVEVSSLDMLPSTGEEGGFRLSGIEITVSIGIASSLAIKSVSPLLLIEKADAALYQAKEAGRNTVYPKSEPKRMEATAPDSSSLS